MSYVECNGWSHLLWDFIQAIANGNENKSENGNEKLSRDLPGSRDLPLSCENDVYTISEEPAS